MSSLPRTVLTLVLAWLIALPGYTQLKSAFTHYSVEDGLSEGVVLTMVQDRQGLMWFGTFDGLNRFDGYSFRVYKSGFRSGYALRNNRVDRITEDDFGYLWIMNNDGEVYRMNPRTEEFISFNEVSTAGQKDYSPVNQIFCLKGGETWLPAENGICTRVISAPDNPGFNTERFVCRSDSSFTPVVKMVYRDSLKNVWILTGRGLFRMAAGESGPSQVRFPDPQEKSFSFNCLHEAEEEIWFGTEKGRIIITDKSGNLRGRIDLDVNSDIISIKQLNPRENLILTSGNGFFVYNTLSGERRQYSRRLNRNLPSDIMVSAYIDRYGEVWLETDFAGVTHFDPVSGSLQHFSMKVDHTNPNVLLPSFAIFEDRNNNLWVYPRGGGFSLYNRQKRELEYFYNEPGSSERRFPNLIHSALSDNQGNLWMCTIQRGIEKISFFPSQFRSLSPKPAGATHSENEVRAIFEDRNRNLWVATRDGYVYLYNPERKQSGYLRENGSFTSGKPFNALVYSITQDNNGNIWMGSKGRGLFRLTPSGERNLAYSISNFRHDDADPYSLSHDNVYSVYQDGNGRIWVGTFNGGINYIETDGAALRFINSFNLLRKYPYANHKRVRHITSDNRGRIWVGTTSGLLLFDMNFTDPSKIRFTSCFFDPDNENSIANNDVHYIYCSPEGEVFAATFGGGLNRVINPDSPDQAPLFKSYTVRTGAPDDVILSIVDDREGNLWLSSERGILKFNISSETFEIYSEQSGVEKRYFSEAAGIRSDDRQIMFGYDNGIYIFDPLQVRKTTYVPPLVFTRTMVSGKEVHPSGSPEQGDGSSGPVIELSNRQKSLNIEYAALDYRNPSGIQYAHLLENIDDDWSIERGQRAASYTNLSPGEYLFRVRSTNADGVWVDNQRTIKVIVHPSFWQTTVARILIVLAVLGLIILTIYIIFTFYKLRHKVEVEQLITNLKLKFFTDISHELRTPLTLISSPVSNILEHNNLDPEVREQLSLVRSNTERMLRLVNQILDFRKVQNRKMRLRIEEFALGPFITGLCDDFRKAAIEKGIVFEVIDHSEGQTIWADRDKVEKIAFNLITNALKFTPKGRRVTVTVTASGENAGFIVADEGAGLSREKMKNLFMRFDSDDRRNGTMQPGTGIGLSLSRELAELHHAELTAKSEEGYGSVFSVTFRLGFSHFDNDTEFVVSDGNDLSHVPGDEITGITDEEETPGNDDDPLLLFVEDNEELRSFLRIVLADSYHVIEAGNGKEGFEIARSQLPDLIITDLMMPEMDGLELAGKLKSETTTSHIPVIVLTARTDMDTQVETLRTGADDFIAKPFSSTYLKARIENILRQRKQLQEIFLSNLDSYRSESPTNNMEIEPALPRIEPYDEKLIRKVMEVMEKNIDNSDLTVDDLAAQTGIGRSVFFKKMKSITGLAPIEFIREVRVKRAAQLIRSNEYTISQVTYMVGCNDPRYFSRIFKNRFGMTPTEYREKHTTDKED